VGGGGRLAGSSYGTCQLLGQGLYLGSQGLIAVDQTRYLQPGRAGAAAQGEGTDRGGGRGGGRGERLKRMQQVKRLLKGQGRLPDIVYSLLERL
jgi:hypothetical protein